MRDLRTELREYIDAAAEPVRLDEVQSPSPGAEVRRLPLRFLLPAVAALALVVATVALRDGGADRVEVVAPDPRSTTSAPQGGHPPSQAPWEAARDGVVPAVAELPVATRVRPLVRAPASEGVWVVSRLEPGTGSDGCVLGDPDGVYGRDRVCDMDYGELLLLDASETRVRRAFPLPGLPPQALLVTDDAVYCGRQGDGALPDSMLCRVDRKTLQWTVRVFRSPDSGFTPPPGAPGSWTLDDSAPDAVFGELVLDGGVLVTRGPAGSARVDPTSLVLAGRR